MAAAVRARLSRRPAWVGEAWADVWPVFWRSRLLVLVVAACASSFLVVSPEVARETGAPWLHPFGQWPLGGVVDFWLTPLARWDAIWYLAIAGDGYFPEAIPGNAGDKHAFFPLYPLLVRILSLNGGAGRVLAASQVVSLISLLVGLLCVHRLTVLELGRRHARPAVALLAFAPAAYFFSAPYTESLFLALTAGAFLAARTERWAAAAALGALAAATRNTGALLVVPLLLLYLQRPGTERPWAGLRRPRVDVLWLALVPLGLAAYAWYLDRTTGDPFAFGTDQDPFGRTETVTPFEGAWDGARAFVVDGIAKLGGAPDLAAQNVVNFLALLLAAAAIAGAARVLPLAYAAWAAISVLVPLCAPAVGEPLRAMPRYVLVLFPVWMWLAWACERRGWTSRVVTGFTIALTLLTAAFSTWVSWN